VCTAADDAAAGADAEDEIDSVWCASASDKIASFN